MTEVEAIERIKDLSDRGYPMLRKAKHMAISALKEIQQYRAIGTVEECREVVEKWKVKKPKDSIKINPVIDGKGTSYPLCPNCGTIVGMKENCDKFCYECGQAIAEDLEGMKDEQD